MAQSSEYALTAPSFFFFSLSEFQSSPCDLHCHVFWREKRFSSAAMQAEPRRPKKTFVHLGANQRQSFDVPHSAVCVEEDTVETSEEVASDPLTSNIAVQCQNIYGAFEWLLSLEK